MKKLFTKSEAVMLTINGDARKDQVIGLMNKEITEQAKKGLRWAHFPAERRVKLPKEEREWLRKELESLGFIYNGKLETINW